MATLIPLPLNIQVKISTTSSFAKKMTNGLDSYYIYRLITVSISKLVKIRKKVKKLSWTGEERGKKSNYFCEIGLRETVHAQILINSIS